MNRIDLPVGQDTWPLIVRPEALVRPVSPAEPVTDPRALMKAALDAPLGLGAPIRRAFTPDDRVAVVIDPHLPHLAELMAGLMEHLAAAEIPASAVTLLAPPGASDDWLVDLPDEYADAVLESHDPTERKKLAYLATTKAGRRVYLNRTLVDADAVVVLTGRGYDPYLGYAGAEAAVFPTLSDTETRTALVGKFDTHPLKPQTTTEATEVVWLLGNPIFVQVILGPGNTVAEVIAGLPDSTAEGARRQDARWRIDLNERPDLVICAVAGDPETTDFSRLAAAAACGGRVVASGGRIVVLSTAAPALPEAAEVVRQRGDATEAAKALLKHPVDGTPAALLWAFAARAGSLFVASGWPEDTTEELLATPLADPAEVQRLIDAATRVLIIPDADKTMAAVN